MLDGKATTVDLGGGADLIIPPGAMTPGATVHATYQGTPGGTWTAMSPTSAPVKLVSDPPDAIHGLLTLEFPVPAGALAGGVDPATAFGISTYDDSSGTWTPVATAYDAARHMVVAQIPHFSWWNPFTWDYTQLFANITQGFGALVGTRAGAATCNNTGAPGWVQMTPGIVNGADLPIRACVQSQGDVLDIQIQNNRPYGQILTYGGPVKWGWHQEPNTPAETVEYALMDAALTPGELFIPPLGRASVGIFKQGPGATTSWRIAPTVGSVAAELFTFIAAPVITTGMAADVKCASLVLDTPTTQPDAATLRSALTNLGDCLEAGFLSQVASGAVDSVRVSKLGAQLTAIKKAAAVGELLTFGQAVWRVADLLADNVADGSNPAFNGFTLASRSEVIAAPAAPSSQPPAATQPVSPPPPPAPPVQAPPTQPAAAPPAPQAVNVYDNYGPGAIGHAMCRGNPANGLSMPGGTATQTFSVPQGVATLTGAMIQVDPAPEVTAHLTVLVDGTALGSAAAAAAGDTRFSFGSIGVHAGQTVTLNISFTATAGKIITVYTVGSPGGLFTASNSCPDGAPTVSVAPTGLRAVVYGTT